MNQIQKIEKSKEDYFQEIYDDVEWAYGMAECLIEDRKIHISWAERIELAKMMLSQMNVYADAMTEDDDGSN
jgi:hypothetical protein